MKIREALTEAIDVSDLAVRFYKEVPAAVDRAARSTAAYRIEQGYKRNPSDPVQGAYNSII